MSTYDHLIQWCASEAAERRKYIERMESGSVTLQQHIGENVLDITRSTMQIDKLKLDELEALLHTIAANGERSDTSQGRPGYAGSIASAAERASARQA
jgi:hypothetical protein